MSAIRYVHVDDAAPIERLLLARNLAEALAIRGADSVLLLRNPPPELPHPLVARLVSGGEPSDPTGVHIEIGEGASSTRTDARILHAEAGGGVRFVDRHSTATVASYWETIPLRHEEVRRLFTGGPVARFQEVRSQLLLPNTARLLLLVLPPDDLPARLHALRALMKRFESGSDYLLVELAQPPQPSAAGYRELATLLDAAPDNVRLLPARQEPSLDLLAVHLGGAITFRDEDTIPLLRAGIAVLHAADDGGTVDPEPLFAATEEAAPDHLVRNLRRVRAHERLHIHCPVLFRGDCFTTKPLDTGADESLDQLCDHLLYDAPLAPNLGSVRTAAEEKAAIAELREEIVARRGALRRIQIPPSFPTVRSVVALEGGTRPPWMRRLTVQRHRLTLLDPTRPLPDELQEAREILRAEGEEVVAFFIDPSVAPLESALHSALLLLKERPEVEAVMLTLPESPLGVLPAEAGVRTLLSRYILRREAAMRVLDAIDALPEYEPLRPLSRVLSTLRTINASRPELVQRDPELATPRTVPLPPAPIDPARIIEICARAHRADPLAHELLLYKAKAELRAGRLDDARRSLEELIAARPLHEEGARLLESLRKAPPSPAEMRPMKVLDLLR